VAQNAGSAGSPEWVRTAGPNHPVGRAIYHKGLHHTVRAFIFTTGRVRTCETGSTSHRKVAQNAGSAGGKRTVCS